MFKNWGKDVEPPEFTTKEEVQEMIDDAIRKHNRNASIISMCVGWVVLALFAEGLLRLIGVMILSSPLLPLEWIDSHRVGFWGNYVLEGHFIYQKLALVFGTRRQIEKILISK